MPDTPTHAPPVGAPSVGDLARSPLGTAAPEPGLVEDWRKFLSRPEVRTALFQFGVAMLTPQRGGGGALEKLGPALGAAGQAVGKLREGEREEAATAFEQEQQRRRTGLEETRTEAAVTRARAAEAQVEVGRKGLDVEKERNKQLADQAGEAAKLRGSQIRNQGFSAAASFYSTAVGDAARLLKLRLDDISEATLLGGDEAKAEADRASALRDYNASVSQAELLAKGIAPDLQFEAPEAAPAGGGTAPSVAAATDTEIEAAFRSWTAARVGEFISKAPAEQQERLRGIAARVGKAEAAKSGPAAQLSSEEEQRLRRARKPVLPR